MNDIIINEWYQNKWNSRESNYEYETILGKNKWNVKMNKKNFQLFFKK